jgi:[FeFe] hydrogenase H-cluster maturation GTPase HydF
MIEQVSDMNTTPVSSRLHIGIFGRRNAGKSAIINALTNQSTSLVSHVPGTTTDPVFKPMELLPLGPIVLIDTAGLDDQGRLGEMRKKRSQDILNSTDLAVIVIDGLVGVTDFEIELLNKIRAKKIPVIGVINKIDISTIDDNTLKRWHKLLNLELIKISASQKFGIDVLKQEIVRIAPVEEMDLSLVDDLVKPGDTAVLVVPIDEAAPKGRLILPQQQVIRDLLDHDCTAIVTKEYGLKKTLQNLKEKPAIVITDSQVFAKAAADTPDDIYLTSFSILMARYKGDLRELVNGAKAVKNLRPDDKVLISEACTHHRQTDDIGKVKIPKWLMQIVGGDLKFEWFSGKGFPADLKKYDLIVHCGACMLNRREMLHRISAAKEAGVPIVNYGVLIAYIHNILPRALQPFQLN